MALQSARNSLLGPFCNGWINLRGTGPDVPTGKVSLQSLHPEPSASPTEANLGPTQKEESLPNLTTAFTNPPQNTRIDKIIAQGSLEDLEAEVKSGLKFLEELRSPLVGLATPNQYSQHWIQQIGESITMGFSTHVDLA
jgi:hypothetical protein